MGCAVKVSLLLDAKPQLEFLPDTSPIFWAQQAWMMTVFRIRVLSLAIVRNDFEAEHHLPPLLQVLFYFLLTNLASRPHFSIFNLFSS